MTGKQKSTLQLEEGEEDMKNVKLLLQMPNNTNTLVTISGPIPENVTVNDLIIAVNTELANPVVLDGDICVHTGDICAHTTRNIMCESSQQSELEIAERFPRFTVFHSPTHGKRPILTAKKHLSQRCSKTMVSQADDKKDLPIQELQADRGNSKKALQASQDNSKNSQKNSNDEPRAVLKTVRRSKKGSLQYALNLGHRQHLTSLISTKKHLSEKACLAVMECMKQMKESSKTVMTPLQGAVTLGHESIVKHLIEEGADMDEMNSSIPPPLCIAFQNNHIQIAKFLIKSGADVNLEYNEVMPIQFALENGNCSEELIYSMIEAGFPKNGVVCRKTGRTILHFAVEKNLLSMVKYLLINFSVDPNIKDSRGMTPLHSAVQSGNVDIIDLLVQSGAFIDIESFNHLTPMFLAINTRNAKIVAKLVSLGADVNYRNKSKNNPLTPLLLAAKTSHFQITKFLLDNGADITRGISGVTALHAAALAKVTSQQGKISQDCIVELLIRRGSDLEARQSNGLTPLQVAIKSKNFSVIKMLVVNGAKINNKANEYSLTTFHMAAKLCDKEIIKLFLDYGADCMLKDHDKMYPCQQAIITSVLDYIAQTTNPFESPQFSHMSVFKLFWRHGFPCDLTLKIKWLANEVPPIPPKLVAQVKMQMALINGVKSQNVKTVKNAISLGADVKCCTRFIPQPVHYIAHQGNKDILKLFLSHGAVVNSLDKSGKTPLHLAAEGGFLNCCRLLLEHGAVYNHSNAKCVKTPLEIAQEKGHSDIVLMLATVGRFFRIRKGQLKKLIPGMDIFLAVMNCHNRCGETLVGKAIKLGLKDEVERLMNLRLQKNLRPASSQ